MGRVGRKLVTVRRVAGVRPIPSADRIETVTVSGWTCVCRVGDFKPGDLALFFEIDSFLPAADLRWGFLGERFGTFQGEKGFRVKSMKIRGQMSQGILQRLEDFSEVAAALEILKQESGDGYEKVMFAQSFEDVLGVKKWDHQAAMADSASAQNQPENQSAMGPLPYFIQETDQERIQNLPGVFEDWSDQVFQESTKMDGSSATVYFIRNDSALYPGLPPFNPTGGTTGDLATGRFGVCSRRIELVERAGNKFWDAAKRNCLPQKLEALGRNLAIQGELCGSSIQDNFEGFPTGFHDMYVFAVWDINAQKHLAPREAERVAQDLGLRHVPVHGYCKLADIGSSVAELLLRAEGKGVNGRKREGIVLKHEEQGFNFKAISNSYLLKHGE